MRLLKLPLLYALLAVLLIVSLILFSPHAFAQTTTGGTAKWSWTAPADFTNGMAIPSSDTITYNVYIGTAGPGSEASTPVQTGLTAVSVTTSGYAAGQTVCGQITAVVGGLESARSNEACKTFPVPPDSPTGLTVQ